MLGVRNDVTGKMIGLMCGWIGFMGHYQTPPAGSLGHTMCVVVNTWERSVMTSIVFSLATKAAYVEQYNTH